MLDEIRLYGSAAVLGRVMYAREILRCNAALSIYNTYQDRQAAGDWTDWTKKHPREAEMLANVEKLIEEIEGDA